MIYSYAFLRLATPIKPIKPEPNNQAAAGTGTVDTSRTNAWPNPKISLDPIYQDNKLILSSVTQPG